MFQPLIRALLRVRCVLMVVGHSCCKRGPEYRQYDHRGRPDNDLSRRSWFGGEGRAILHPSLFRLDFGLSEKLHGVLVQPSSLYVSSHYTWVP